MVVVGVNRAAGLALCDDETGARSTVETALVGPLATGDRVLVHAGTAIATLSAEALA
jgi:hydrogenase maturation factor